MRVMTGLNSVPSARNPDQNFPGPGEGKRKGGTTSESGFRRGAERSIFVTLNSCKKSRIE